MSNPTLKKLLTYVSKVYGIGEKIKGVKDERKQPQIHASVVFKVMLLGFLLRMESFNELNQWVRYGRFRKLLPGVRLPYVDTIRESLSQYDLEPLQETQKGIVQKAKRNHVFQQGKMGDHVVVALDGVELFESEIKQCDDCLTRQGKDGHTHYFHRSVACMTVGSDPHIVLGLENLHPRQDQAAKDEGELTGGKRLLQKLYDTHHHFADVIVADALYLNAPFIKQVQSIHMDAVIRAKDERLHIVKDALGLFKQREADKKWTVTDPDPKAKRKKKRAKHIDVQAWDDEGFVMKDVNEPVRFLRFVEMITETIYRGKTSKRETTTKEVWIVTTLGKHVPAKEVWKMIHQRWDIENNGFRELKTKWKINHCFMHDPKAIEAILLFIVIAFNLFQLYIFRRVKGFRDLPMTQKFFVEELRFQAISIDTPLQALLE